MRHRLRWTLALAGALLISAPASQAADGIRASAMAVRDVPADILMVTFNMTERIVPSEGARDQRDILAKALEEKGLRVLERTSRHLPMMAPYGASQVNAISSTGALREPIEVRRTVAFRVTGYKRIDDVLDAFGRHGVRQVSLVPYHSSVETVRQELRKEAIERAIAQARRLAAQAGVKTGGVIDLATQPPQTGPAGFIPDSVVAPGIATAQNLIDPRQPGELPRLRITVTANVVLAIKQD
jgi:uncharacterized protein YggE